MMEIVFENPQFLTLLLFIPLFIFLHFLLLKHTRRKAMKFANFDAMKRVTGTTLITRNMSMLFMRIIIITTLVLGASGAILWYEGEASDYDFVIALDSGASMAAEDVEPSRLDVAKEMATGLLESMEYSNIGLVSFAGTVRIDSRLDTKDQVISKIENLGILSYTGTDLAEALITSANILKESNRSRAILLLSDGHDTVGTDLGKGIGYVQSEHIPVYSIGIGTEEGGSFPGLPGTISAVSQLNKDNLMLISNSTGGKYFDYTEGVSQILSELDVQTERTYLSLDLSYYLMAIALLLVIFEWVLTNTRFRLLP